MIPSQTLTLMLALGLFAGSWAKAAEPLERVRVAAESRTFVLHGSGRAFRPYGFNYGNSGRLMEDFWESDWKTLEGDFAEMKQLGANVVRVHLQFGKFMDAPDRGNEASLARLARLIELAEKTGIYLDLTGLGCYRVSDTPKWYDEMNEARRWAAQGRFWEEIAKVGAKSTAVFCYDLMNEPISAAQKREAGQWMSGKPFGGYDFVQYISLDPAGRKREDVAVEWIRTLRGAIRKHDKDALITVGMLPWIPNWGHLSGFIPEKVGEELEFVALHIYPESGKQEIALDTLKRFVTSKPLVIEETFNLSCPPAQLREFLLASREFACGWIGHYDGLTVAEYEDLERSRALTMPQSFWMNFLKLFVELRPALRDEEKGD